MRIHPVVLVACALLGCGDDDSSVSTPATLRLFAFPDAVEPSGQTTIAVELEHPDCDGTTKLCTVCIGVALTQGGGQLFGPPGLDVDGGSLIGVTIASDGSKKLLESLTYVAPNHEGSEVVSASAFSGATSCKQPHSAETLLASSTVRIDIRKPSPASDIGGSAGSAPVAGQGGTIGDAGAAGTGDTADSAGATHLGGMGGV